MLTLAQHTELQAIPPNLEAPAPTAVLLESLFPSPAKWWPACGISRFIYCFGLSLDVLEHQTSNTKQNQDFMMLSCTVQDWCNMVQSLQCWHLQAGSILVQSLQRKNEERLSSTDSKSSQCDSDHKQSFLYSWDCWEMSLIWPQSSKKRKSACRVYMHWVTLSTQMPSRPQLLLWRCSTHPVALKHGL